MKEIETIEGSDGTTYIHIANPGTDDVHVIKVSSPHRTHPLLKHELLAAAECFRNRLKDEQNN